MVYRHRLLLGDDNMENQVIEMYHGGMSAVKIAKELGVTSSKIYWILQKNNVKRRSNKDNSRKYNLEHDFFEKIDTEEKAYWLGFMYADGYLTLSKTGQKLVGVTLSSEDKNHIEKFKESISATYPVNVYVTPVEFEHGIVTIEYARLIMTSDKMFNDLERQGCFQHKSLILEYPSREQVPQSLIRHFLRGYIDGDGCYSDNIKILGTYEFLQGINNELGYFHKVSEHSSSSSLGDSNKNSGYITIGGKEKMNHLVKWLYEDATIYMNRKYDNAMKLIR